MKNKRNAKCEKCGALRRVLHRDHIIPKCKGGTNEESNIQNICANCHEDKTAEDLRGVKRSIETKQRISEAQKKRFKDHPELHPSLGRKHSHTEETKRKMSQTRLGIKLSQTHCEAMSKALTGRVPSCGNSHDRLPDSFTTIPEAKNA